MRLFNTLKEKCQIRLSKSFDSALFSWREIFEIYLPIVGDQIFIYVIGLLNTSMVSSSGQDSVAAMSLANPLSSMIFAIFNAIAAGATVVMAQYQGHGDRALTRRSAGQVIVAVFFIGALSCIATAFAAEPLIRLLYRDIGEAVILKSRDYLIGVGISLLFHSFYMGVFAVLRGVGDSATCLKLSVIINLTHLFFSVIFINVLHLDILGTALSLIVARIIGGACAMYSVMRKKAQIRVLFSDLFRFDFAVHRAVWKVGLPFSWEQVFANGGTLLVQTFLVSFGEMGVAANAIANSVFSLVYMAGAGVSTLAITVVGQCVGAGERALAKSYGKKMMHMATGINLLSMLVFLPAMPLVLALFNAPSDTVDLIWHLLLIAVGAMPFFWSASGILPGVLRAAGDSAFVSNASLILMWVARVGAAWVFCFPLHLGVYGIWISMVFEWVLRTVVFSLRFRGQRWLGKRSLIEP